MDGWMDGLTYTVLAWWELVTCKQFDPGQTREAKADLDPNHLTSVTVIKAWGPHCLCLSRGLQFVRLGEHCRRQQTQTRCCVMQRLVGLYKFQTLFVKLIK